MVINAVVQHFFPFFCSICILDYFCEKIENKKENKKENKIIRISLYPLCEDVIYDVIYMRFLFFYYGILYYNKPKESEFKTTETEIKTTETEIKTIETESESKPIKEIENKKQLYQ